MAIWDTFEIDCTNYLNSKFGDYASFIHQGGSDSTVPDILVKTNSGKTLYIEAKHCPAQCGQFVLLPNLSTKKFDYSPLNATSPNIYTQMITEYMNADFDRFKEAGTSGEGIVMPDGIHIFANWIIKTYQDKGVQLIITNGNKIIPITDFESHFNITAKYRIKRSGSAAPGSRSKEVLSYLKSHDFGITDMNCENGKIFVSSIQPIHATRFCLNGYEYMFSARDDIYEIRKLSNTFNANVIFSISNISSQPGLFDDEVVSYLR